MVNMCQNYMNFSFSSSIKEEGIFMYLLIIKVQGVEFENKVFKYAHQLTQSRQVAYMWILTPKYLQILILYSESNKFISCTIIIKILIL